jgi:segregation and condensation protein A
MRAAADALFARPLLATNIHVRGMPEGVRATRSVVYEADLHDLLSAYSSRRVKQAKSVYRPPTPKVYGLETARDRLETLMPQLSDWRDLDSLLPGAGELGANPPPMRSVRASSMLAALEITKEGHARLRQQEAYAPLYVRSLSGEEGATDD